MAKKTGRVVTKCIAHQKPSLLARGIRFTLLFRGNQKIAGQVMRCASSISYPKAARPVFPSFPAIPSSVLSSCNPSPQSHRLRQIRYSSISRSLSRLSRAACQIITTFGIRQPRSNNRAVPQNSFPRKRLLLTCVTFVRFRRNSISIPLRSESYTCICIIHVLIQEWWDWNC